MEESPGNLDNHPAPARGLDRRQLLRAGAWAAPVLIIATATPAASASNAILEADALLVSSGSIFPYGGTIGVGVQLYYYPPAWGDVSPAEPPTTLTATALVDVIDTNNVVTPFANPSAVFTQFDSEGGYTEQDGFEIGETYTVRMQTTSIVLDPATSQGVTFTVTPIFIEQTFVMNESFFEVVFAGDGYFGPGRPTP